MGEGEIRYKEVKSWICNWWILLGFDINMFER